MIFRRKNPEKEDRGISEDIGMRLLRSLLFRIYNMIYEIPLKWWEYLIMASLGVFMGLGVGVVLSAMVKVRLP